MSAFSHWNVQKAIYETLSADSTLMASLSGVFDRVQEGAALPYAVLGEAQSRDWSTKTTNGLNLLFTLHIFSRKGGRKEAATLMDRAHALLHNASLTPTGHTMVMSRFDSADILLEPDGNTFHGMLRLRVLTSEI